MCGKQLGDNAVGGGARQLPPHSPADLARWNAACDDAVDLINDGKYDEALASLRRVLAPMEGAMGKEAEELLEPLGIIGDALIRSGRLDDAYNVMIRSMTLCEKHHGEEGMKTCRLRTDMGEPQFRFPSPPSFLPSPFVLPPLLCHQVISLT